MIAGLYEDLYGNSTYSSKEERGGSESERMGVSEDFDAFPA